MQNVYLQNTASTACDNISLTSSLFVTTGSRVDHAYFEDGSYVTLLSRNEGTSVGLYLNRSDGSSAQVVDYPYIMDQKIVAFTDKSFVVGWSSFTTSASQRQITLQSYDAELHPGNVIVVPISKKLDGVFKMATLGNAYILAFFQDKYYLAIQKYDQGAQTPIYTIYEPICATAAAFQLQSTPAYDAFVVAVSHGDNTTIRRYNSANGLMFNEYVVRYNVSKFEIAVTQDATALIWQESDGCANVDNLPSFIQVFDNTNHSYPVTQVSSVSEDMVLQAAGALYDSYVVMLSHKEAMTIRWFYNNSLVSELFTTAWYHDTPKDVEVSLLSESRHSAVVAVSYIVDSSVI